MLNVIAIDVSYLYRFLDQYTI